MSAGRKAAGSTSARTRCDARVTGSAAAVTLALFPRLGRAGLLVPSREVGWLFVFKDNSSREVLDAPIDMEDVRGVKEYLGVKPQRTKWYDVTSWVH